jgi:DNA-binding transcriptional regulator YiaG
MDYKETLAAIREKMRLTRTELAARIGVSTITIERWENGRFNPHPVFARQIDALKKEAGL